MEKLTYRRHALKDGLAVKDVKGLPRSADQYEEAIVCLKRSYDRPRLVHQVHVRAILEAPYAKGNGKDLRPLHDIVNGKDLHGLHDIALTAIV